MFKKALKNQKGLTLIELLAVVVILGIITAIAIPSIGGIIDNSKKDAHVANAQQMINGARIAQAGGEAFVKADLQGATVTSGDAERINLITLIDQGYIETFDSPDGDGYDTDDSFVLVVQDGNTFVYKVKLVADGDGRGIATDEGDPVTGSSLDRDSVTPN